MISLENSILATLVYYDCLNCPLSAFELWQRLIRPISDRGEGGKWRVTLLDIVLCLEESAFLKERIEERNGFFFLKGREDLVSHRIKAIKISEEKLKLLWRYRFIFLASAFIEGVFISGSVAQGLAREESDIDVLVITKAHRLWTARFFLTLWASMLRVRRKDQRIKDKICLNHYITSDSLKIPFESLHNAQSYVYLIPLLNQGNVFERFFKQNQWMERYFLHKISIGEEKDYTFEFRERKFLASFLSIDRRFDEFVLGGCIGDMLEWLAKKIQVFFIQKNPLTNTPGGRIIAQDWQLEFHPQSKEKQILEEYNKKLQTFGLTEFYPEKDSGLLTNSIK